MAEAVPVRCPACLRENGYTVPVYPCACGSPVHPPLDLAAPPDTLTHRTWSESWVTVRCASCGRESEWPHPEVGCASCGTVVRIAVHPVHPEPAGQPAGAGPRAGSGGERAAGRPPRPGGPDSGVGAGTTSDATPEAAATAAASGSASGSGSGPGDGADARSVDRRDAPRDPASAEQSPPAATPVPRPAFRPVTIRTTRDAVATAALYLRWLGFQDVRQPDGRPIPSAAVDLRAPGLVAQVDPTTAPAGLRAVECVWLNGLTASATSVYFSLAGYTEDARTRADDLGIPLFVMDLTGMPQPVNDPADELVGSGA
ncbi:hypothetical protein [Streptomyces subrutilus]|uniref:Restriction endonuclease type IV Mrr domain-containing protein n=1 Tax=Streptomyces subrutilus TaxID=36818 RepID=A0A1E5PXX0_9ACTN|nr:hypothetical protein [Streptomyces subrutilus]OEJ34366.1 hypothetical protein BGK67_26205 [Streptomyces subrutilus]